ncbi:MFS transporter [Anaerobacillus sp. MEB173]|uniref:MFS transporter n=1 Tax=Anaerobacillus sp. MEB173 TaxID=3383345 RepID=UPI003F91060B
MRKEINEQNLNSPVYRFIVLVIMVAITGFSQGMLLPLLSIMLETIGVSSSLNGINAAGLYIGILLVSPFIEKPLRIYGYKPIIMIGLVLVTVSLLLFPFWQVFWFWFILRIIVGIGDNMVHFATQVWITSTSSLKTRGRNLSIYGFAFGMGFAIGPMMTRLLSINPYLPFIIASIASFLTWGFVIFLRNEWPEKNTDAMHQLGVWQRYKAVFRQAWFALLPGFCYGFLEASLHGNFPVYALRSGIAVDWVSILLPSFVIGGLITQLPLGIISDRFGRRNIVLLVTSLGFVSFLSMNFFESSMNSLLILFVISGALVGSLYSLGIAFLADILPRHLLPTGNVMVAISFGIGSMIGPIIGGIFIDLFDSGSIYFLISGVLLLVSIAGLCFKGGKNHQNETVEGVA